MNNRGFAITSVLYGLLILFLLVMVSTLRILSSQKDMMDELIDGHDGARDIVKLEKISVNFDETSDYLTPKKAMYVYGTCSKYYDSGVTITAADFNSGCIN